MNDTTYKIVIVPERRGFSVYLYYRMVNPTRTDVGATWDMDISIYAKTYWGARFAAWRLNRRMSIDRLHKPSTAYEGKG